MLDQPGEECGLFYFINLGESVVFYAIYVI